MKRKLTILATVVAMVTVGVFLTISRAGAIGPGDSGDTDFTLFDNEIGAFGGPDKTAFCKSNEEYVIRIAVRAINGPATVREQYGDGDFIDFPLADNQVFSWSEEAGSHTGVNSTITIKPANASSHFVAQLSAHAHEENSVVCSHTK
jgi:hypothetical protein